MESAKNSTSEGSQVSSSVSKKHRVFVPFSAVPIPPSVQPGQTSWHYYARVNKKRLVICYVCGEPGHYSNKCPQRIVCAPQQVQMVNRGHLNHVVLQEAQKAPDVVLGMLRVNLAPASVLFDSGASHSYISSQFAVMQHVPFEKMLSPLVIHVPGAICQSSQQIGRAHV